MKKKIIFWIVLLLIYCGSVWINYDWFHKAFSLNGKWHGQHADIGAVVFTFCPIFNIMSACDNLMGSPYRDPVPSNYDAWFNVKK